MYKEKNDSEETEQTYAVLPVPQALLDARAIWEDATSKEWREMERKVAKQILFKLISLE